MASPRQDNYQLLSDEKDHVINISNQTESKVLAQSISLPEIIEIEATVKAIMGKLADQYDNPHYHTKSNARLIMMLTTFCATIALITTPAKNNTEANIEWSLAAVAFLFFCILCCCVKAGKHPYAERHISEQLSRNDLVVINHLLVKYLKDQVIIILPDHTVSVSRRIISKLYNDLQTEKNVLLQKDNEAREFLSVVTSESHTRFSMFSPPTKIVLEYIGGEKALQNYQAEYQKQR